MLAKISAVTKLQPKHGSAKEFLVHVEQEYDYKFNSSYCEIIISLLIQISLAHLGSEIAIYGVQAKLEMY